jgi:hypothetical protein
LYEAADAGEPFADRLAALPTLPWNDRDAIEAFALAVEAVANYSARSVNESLFGTGFVGADWRDLPQGKDVVMLLESLRLERYQGSVTVELIDERVGGNQVWKIEFPVRHYGVTKWTIFGTQPGPDGGPPAREFTFRNLGARRFVHCTHMDWHVDLFSHQERGVIRMLRQHDFEC